MSHSATALELTRLAQPLRRWTAVGTAVVAAAVGTTILTLFAWTARLGWLDHPGWVLVTWILVLVGVGGGIALGLRRLERLSPAGLADRLERDRSWRRGALRGLLRLLRADTTPAGSNRNSSSLPPGSLPGFPAAASGPAVTFFAGASFHGCRRSFPRCPTIFVTPCGRCREHPVSRWPRS